MVGIVGEAAYAPPSILYCTLNPATAVTVDKVKAILQVLAGVVRTGAAGKITILTVLLAAQEPVPIAPVKVLPQSAANTYRA